jgi:electron transport complex protein RnfE
MDQKKSSLSVLLNGLIKENPVLVLVLGTCPSLAVSTMAVNGLGMGVAATFVLVCSNVFIALLKDIIPDKVRIPCYIVLIAGFTTIVQLVVSAYFPAIDKALGLYIPLIVVNCIILGRAEMFANKNNVWHSLLDGVGMGAGFTLALLVMGTVREILGSGTWFGLPITKGVIDPMLIFILAPGGFFVYGCTIALVNRITKGKGVKRKEFGCQGCPSFAACAKAGKGAQ